MALLPGSVDAIIAKFALHLARSQGVRLDGGVTPDEVVKTHCCFCGQQCGIQLLVKDNQVIDFEPWMDFPFNTGKLCPKGVKRYLQGSHRDRLLHAYERDETAPGGSSPSNTTARLRASLLKSGAFNRKLAVTHLRSWPSGWRSPTAIGSSSGISGERSSTGFSAW
jgi:assimilatory nitrate reductase catalytic subunit